MYHFKIVRHLVGDETKFETEVTDLLNDGWGTFSRLIILDGKGNSSHHRGLSYMMAMFKDDNPPANPVVQFFGSGEGGPPPGEMY